MIKLLLHYSRKHFCILILSLVLGGSMVSCDAEEPCASLATNRFRVAFVVPGEENDTISEFFFFDEVRAVGAEKPFFIRNDTLRTGLNLSLDPDSDTTTFVFYYEEERRDTLQLSYQRNSRMISPDCELAIEFTNIRMIKEPFTAEEDVSVYLETTELSEKNTGADLLIFSRKVCEPQPTADKVIRIGFFSLNDGNKEPEPVAFQSISVQNSDGIFYQNPDEPMQEFDLHLNPDANSITYVFQERGKPNDTIRFNYERRLPVVASAFCFPDIRFEDISAKSSFGTDSVRVVNNSLPVDSESIDVEIFR